VAVKLLTGDSSGETTYELGDVADDVALLHRRGLGCDLVARVVDGAEKSLHALRAEANFFVCVPPIYHTGTQDINK